MLLDASPIKGGTDTKDGSAELELVLALEFSCYVYADTLGWVVNLGVTPSLFCLVVFQSFYDDDLVNIDIA